MIEQSSEEINGVIDEILYHNQNNNFYIFTLKSSGKKITAKGLTPNIFPGKNVVLQGTWVNHKKFGNQFEIVSCISSEPNTQDGLQKYLSSNLIQGIGEVYAKKLINRFGTNVLKIIDKSPKQLKEIPGIGEKRLKIIVSSWQEQKDISSIMIFLKEKGISTTFAIKIYKKYK